MRVMLASARQLGIELGELLLHFAATSFLGFEVEALLEGLPFAFAGEVELKLYAVCGIIQDYLRLLESAFKFLVYEL